MEEGNGINQRERCCLARGEEPTHCPGSGGLSGGSGWSSPITAQSPGLPHSPFRPYLPIPLPHHPSDILSNPPPGSPTALGGIKRRKPAEYDGKVAWEAYSAQFEMLADAQGWDGTKRALQLASALRGQAVEVLGHLTPVQRSSYQCVVGAIQWRFSHQHQAEVYRARLKKRVWRQSETLPQLAQDVESLVRRAHPSAPEEMVIELAHESFIDALQDQQLQIYIKQAHPGDLQVAPARALEFEAFLGTTGNKEGQAESRYDMKARRYRVGTSAASGRASPCGFKSACWGPHTHRQFPKERRTGSPGRTEFQPVCRDCGKLGHRSSACLNPKEVVQAGNGVGLDKGAESQPFTNPWPRTQ